MAMVVLEIIVAGIAIVAEAEAGMIDTTDGVVVADDRQQWSRDRWRMKSNGSGIITMMIYDTLSLQLTELLCSLHPHRMKQQMLRTHANIVARAIHSRAAALLRLCLGASSYRFSRDAGSKTENPPPDGSL